MKNLAVLFFTVLLLIISLPSASATDSDVGTAVPWLVKAERTSADALGPNDMLSIDWEVRDVDVQHVVFSFKGPGGTTTAAQWFGKGQSGTATVRMDEYAHSDELELTGISLSGPRGYIDFRDDGKIWSNYGLDTSGQVLPDFTPFGFTYTNPDVGTAVPWLVKAERTSADALGPNDMLSIDWEVRDVDVQHVVFSFKGPGGTTTAAQWFGKGQSGTATVRMDEYAHSDELELTGISLSGPRGYIDFRDDGKIWSNYGLDTSGQVLPDFTPFGFTYTNPDVGTAVPWLVKAERTSADALGPNDMLSIDWEVRDVDVQHVVFSFKGPGGTTTAAQWFGKGQSGTATVRMDEYAHSDELELTGISLSGPRGYIDFRDDGKIWSNYGLDTSGQVLPDFTPFGFTYTNPYSPKKVVVPAPVQFTDLAGAKDDFYVIPVVSGVEYLVNGAVKAPGKYSGNGMVTVTARASIGYLLTPGSTTEWSTTFSSADGGYTPPAVSPFADVATNQLFYKEMSWLASQGISTGWAEANGTRTYRALQPVNRDAMAAFLYRAAGSPAYTPPAVSPFADVATNQLFYKEMSWLASQGISTGWAEANGTRTYRALQPVNRDAMAAFLYRAAGSPAYTPPAVSPFADVATNQLFYKEMSWLASQGISTGWAEANGTRTYRALQPVNRDAMAAFLYRAAGTP